MEVIGNWVWEINLRPLVEVFAWLTGYEILEEEWHLIMTGVQGTDSDAQPERWFDYEFNGCERVTFSLAKDGGSSVICVRMSAEEPLRAKLELAIEIMNRYELIGHNA